MNNPFSAYGSSIAAAIPFQVQQASSAHKFPLLLSTMHLQRKRLARRALTELGRRTPNDVKNTLKFAEKLLTIDTEAFAKKYNFDPIKMQPVNSASQKYEWSPVKQTEKQDIGSPRSLFGSSVNGRQQLLLCKIPMSIVQNSTETKSETVEKSPVEATLKPTESTDSKETEKTETPVSISTETCEELKERLCQKTGQSVDNCVSTEIPTVTASHIKKNSSSGSKIQTKITDFAVHRKRPRSSTEEKSPSEEPSLSSASKKAKMLS